LTYLRQTHPAAQGLFAVITILYSSSEFLNQVVGLFDGAQVIVKLLYNQRIHYWRAR
jgi:hypothetical protein